MLHLQPEIEVSIAKYLALGIRTAAFANAMFSPQGPPEKWKTLIPVKIRPSEERAAHPTRTQISMGL
jgi:hypothetical protein